MNEAVLQAVEEHVLTPEAIEQVIQLTERQDTPDQQAVLARELRDSDKRLKHITAALETGGDIATLVARSRELEARRRTIRSDMASLQPLPRLAPKVIPDRLAEYRQWLRGSITQGRAVLQRVLVGRLTFTPREDGGYDFSAPTRFDKLFTGIVVERPAWIPQGGVPAHIGPEDTFDADYGRLLENALQGWRARRESNPRPTGSKPAALSS